MTGWDDLYADASWRKWAERPLLPITEHWISGLRERGARRVFDMGCGLGRHTVALAKMGFEVVASDISLRALRTTRDKLAASGLIAEVIESDMTEIPYPDAYFDAVLSLGVLEHGARARIEEALSEVHRTLRPRGQALASFLPRTRWIPKEDPTYDMVEDNTLRSYGPERSIHHMVDDKELAELFAAFTILSMELRSERFDSIDSQEWFVAVEKSAE